MTDTGARRVLRVVWVTNLQAPYREPVWRELANVRQIELKVHFMAAQHKERPWIYSARSGYPSQVMRTIEVPSRNPDQSVYVHLNRQSSELGSPHVVILGSWESPAYWQILMWAKFRRVGVVVFLEAGQNSSRYVNRHPIARARRFFYRKADAVLCAGETSRQVALDMGVPESRLITSFNTVDVSEVRRHISAGRDEAAHNSAGHDFIFAGRLISKKNVPLLLRAFEQMWTEEDRLIIVGEGPEERRIANLLQALPVHVRAAIVRMPMLPANDLYRVLTRAQTLVLPSSVETWGMVVNEALAAGLHVVLSETVGAAESVRGMLGVYVVRDVEHNLAAAMNQSRIEWQGYIQQPEILGYNARTAADDVVSACLLAKRISERHSS